MEWAEFLVDQRHPQLLDMVEGGGGENTFMRTFLNISLTTPGWWKVVHIASTCISLAPLSLSPPHTHACTHTLTHTRTHTHTLTHTHTHTHAHTHTHTHTYMYPPHMTVGYFSSECGLRMILELFDTVCKVIRNYLQGWSHSNALQKGLPSNDSQTQELPSNTSWVQVLLQILSKSTAQIIEVRSYCMCVDFTYVLHIVCRYVKAQL